MMTDIEIAQSCRMKPITEIAATAHVEEQYLEQYGKYKAKVDPALLKNTDRSDGKLILVTAITPTPAGEGKTTTTIGLADGLRRIGKDVTVALRAAPPEAAMRRWCRWRTSTSILPGIFTPSVRQTTCLPLCLTTISSRETAYRSTHGRSPGAAVWT